MAFQTVATVGDLRPGDIVPIKLGNVRAVLLRIGDRYHAVQRDCPHHGADLAEGIVSRAFIICPMHGWRFDAASGRHESSPVTCLKTYVVRIQGTEIQVDC